MEPTPNETNIEIAGTEYSTNETENSESCVIGSERRSGHKDGREETAYGKRPPPSDSGPLKQIGQIN